AGSIVIQPPGLLQGPNQFLLPSQTPATVSQPGGAARPLLGTSSPQAPSARAGAQSSGQLVDGAQILTAPSRQLNFSPVFTTPTGQLAVRQGALLSGPLQLQSAPPAVFQMPAQLAGAYPPQGPGQRGTLLHSTTLGNQITLINSPAMLAPDMASISIVNGPSVVQGLPFAPQAPPAPQEKQLNLPQTSVLLLPDNTGPDAVEEPYLHLSQPNQQSLLQHNHEPAPSDLQIPPTPVVTLLPPLPEPAVQHEPAPSTALPKHLIPQPEEQRVQKEVPDQLSQKHTLLHQMHQVLELPSPSTDGLTGTLPAQLSPPSSPPAPASQRVDAASLLPSIGQTVALAVTPSPGVVPASAHSVVGQTGTLIGQNSLSLPPVSFPSPPTGQAGILARAAHEKGGTLAGISGLGGSALSPLSAVHSTQLQPASLHTPVGPRALTKTSTQTPIQQRTQELAAGLAVDAGLFAPSAHIHTQLTLEPPVQMGVQPSTQVTACVNAEREERLTLAIRRHRTQQQLCQDHSVVLNPDTRAPFLSLEDAVSRLLPYHTCTGHLPGPAGFITVDQQFDAVSGVLLKRTKDMLNKYRQLLLGEAQQVSPSAEMVMLERLFLQAERGLLGEERRKARLDPEAFLLSLRKPASGSNDVPTSTPSPYLQSSGSPPSSPSWALLSNRPPGLKTYRSSSRGALKLTIKHESGSRKVVHNS
ncbi:hypothetical protein GJAV_G00003610, partial [Gymnothorax javanicus]